jgi:glutathione S-transferase
MITAHLVSSIRRKVPAMRLSIVGFTTLLTFSYGFTSSSISQRASLHSLSMSSATSVATPSWEELQSTVGETPVGQALNNEVQLRTQGKGSPHVQSKKRLFRQDDDPAITLFRDHAGWCPYCQKTMLLIEEKQVPIKIVLVPMRSYGDKPREFLQKVPSGLLPALEVNGQVITESSVIMDLLDRWHPPEDGYKPMMPQDEAGMRRYEQLARLERELFSWWCTLLFRPELGGGGNAISRLMGGGGGDGGGMSGSMQGFLDCIQKVNVELKKTKGPWFFDNDYPTMIDFVFVSHVERMLASCAYWKGLNLRDPKWKLDGINDWLEAFEKKEYYLAFKSDYYTHVKDIPPQYGPGNDGGFEADRKEFSSSIKGTNGSWTLPLSHDDPIQPLYKGPPLPLSILESVDIHPDADGAYEKADPVAMKKACQLMAAWKLAGNGVNIARFAARGGPEGARNPRKTFGAELADPYAAADESVIDSVDEALRIVCLALKETDQQDQPDATFQGRLNRAVPPQHTAGVVSSISYLRDRVGVPRDLPLASGRYFRAYLNWAIDTLS